MVVSQIAMYDSFKNQSFESKLFNELVERISGNRFQRIAEVSRVKRTGNMFTTSFKRQDFSK